MQTFWHHVRRGGKKNKSASKYSAVVNRTKPVYETSGIIPSYQQAHETASIETQELSRTTQELLTRWQFSNLELQKKLSSLESHLSFISQLQPQEESPPYVENAPGVTSATEAPATTKQEKIAINSNVRNLPEFSDKDKFLAEEVKGAQVQQASVRRNLFDDQQSSYHYEAHPDSSLPKALEAAFLDCAQKIYKEGIHMISDNPFPVSPEQVRQAFASSLADLKYTSLRSELIDRILLKDEKKRSDTNKTIPPAPRHHLKPPRRARGPPIALMPRRKKAISSFEIPPRKVAKDGLFPVDTLSPLAYVHATRVENMPLSNSPPVYTETMAFVDSYIYSINGVSASTSNPDRTWIMATDEIKRQDEIEKEFPTDEANDEENSLRNENPDKPLALSPEDLIDVKEEEDEKVEAACTLSLLLNLSDDSFWEALITYISNVEDDTESNGATANSTVGQGSRMGTISINQCRSHLPILFPEIYDGLHWAPKGLLGYNGDLIPQICGRMQEESVEFIDCVKAAIDKRVSELNHDPGEPLDDGYVMSSPPEDPEMGSSSNSTQNHNYLSNNAVTSSTIQGSGNGRVPKRRRENNNDRGDDEDDDERLPKKQVIQAIKNLEQKLACPFAKADPDRHPRCQLINRKNLSGVKEHLKRSHFGGILPVALFRARTWGEVFICCNEGWARAIPSPHLDFLVPVTWIHRQQTSELQLTNQTNESIQNNPIRDITSTPFAPIMPRHPNNSSVDSNSTNSDQQGSILTNSTTPSSGVYPSSPKQTSFDLQTIESIPGSRPMNISETPITNTTSLPITNPLPQEGTDDFSKYIYSDYDFDIGQILSAIEGFEQEAPSFDPGPSTQRIPLIREDPHLIPPTSDGCFGEELPLNASATPSEIHPSNMTAAVQQPQEAPPTHTIDTGDAAPLTEPPALTPDNRDTATSTESPESVTTPSNQNVDIIVPTAPKANKKYTVRIRRRDRSPNQQSSEKKGPQKFQFDDIDEFQRDFEAWMFQTFSDPVFCWQAWEFENPKSNERISDLEGMADELEFIWDAYRTEGAAFFLVPKVALGTCLT
ncbi:hypothetical protein H072_10009 [Dactylellina haptotyla CBS 200.50]|uniref:Uncharacterized protein n=1 Tax=Dactylellina haptotyla (strain CBS 200.50) TaxID=1284197 RepID=S8A5T0_DACHA|nr:hypothetical protein H072_10009 [Dactylellina haptotyla CBS 200.50]